MISFKSYYNRSSNFELLRIMAMFMIVIFHIEYHCVKIQLTDLSSITMMDNGLFCNPLFYKKLFILQGLETLGRISNGIFLLISGYYTVEKKSLDIIKIARKLLSQLGFAIVALSVLSFVYFIIEGSELSSFGYRGVTDFNTYAWFPGYYFLVILVAGTILNKHLNKWNRKEYNTFLIAIFALVSFSWTGELLNSFMKDFRTVFTGIFLYAMGGYIKKYDPFGWIKSRGIIIMAFLMYIFIYLSYYNKVQSSIKKYLFTNVLNAAKGSNTELFLQPLLLFEDYSIVSIALAIMLFELFRRISIPQIPIINFLGSSSLMIYLMHDNNFWFEIWKKKDWIDVLYRNPWSFCIDFLKLGVEMCIVGVVTYLLYTLLVNILKGYYET